jgi:hypothetical protein
MSDWRNRFSAPSRMDTFAMYLTNEYWGRKDEDGELIEFTDQLFVDELLKRFEKTPEMKAGTALHKLLEQSKYGEIMADNIIIDDEEYHFKYESAEPLIIVVPPLREQKIQKVFGDMIINGILDGVDATTGYDHKLTKQIRYEKYANSWQKSIYLWMTGLNYFKYNIFQGKVTFCKIDSHIGLTNIYTTVINKFESFDFERYGDMDRDVEDFYTYYWEVLDKLKPLIIETAHKNNIVIKGLTT